MALGGAGIVTGGEGGVPGRQGLGPTEGLPGTKNDARNTHVALGRINCLLLYARKSLHARQVSAVLAHGHLVGLAHLAHVANEAAQDLRAGRQRRAQGKGRHSKG